MNYRGEKSKPKVHKRRWFVGTLLVLFSLYFFPIGLKVGAHYADSGRSVSWYDLRKDSSQQAPDPTATQDAIIQVYAARAMRWRGALGVHSWIATKRTDQQYYTRLEVMGYNLRWGGQAVEVRRGQPDRYWYGNAPVLLREIRGGKDVDAMIDKLHAAANQYIYNDHYRVWPGPNSNTFIAHLARQVPELKLDLPPTAIGKDYLLNGKVLKSPPSGSGFQFSLGGLFGFILSPEEGVELNILGLSAGVDFWPLALKLPAIGRVGFSDFKRAEY